MASLTAREAVLVPEKPLAEVLVEGELSPFEHETLYRILRRGFRLEHPSYTQLLDEDLATRVNVTSRRFLLMFSGRTGVISKNYLDRSDIGGEKRAPQLRSLSSVTIAG
jgi:hypothetical protein